MRSRYNEDINTSCSRITASKLLDPGEGKTQKKFPFILVQGHCLINPGFRNMFNFKTLL